MKKLLFFFAFVLTLQLHAQNKSLGVGTTTPNANAALHVESPTGNQGFIMPRLTTAQRNAMVAVLTVNDLGMMLYDTDLKSVYVWNGTTWLPASSSQLNYPYKDSVVTSPPAGVFDVFALKYAGAANARVMRIESISPTNLSSGLSVLQRGRGLAGYFEQFNDTTASTALTARIRTNKVIGPNQLAPVAVYGESTGTGALGGAFWNINAANTWPALYSRTLGVGNAARFDIVNATSSGTALVAATDGLGAAANFTINNASSTASALNAATNGVGSAASFSTSNPANTQPTLYVNNNANSTTVEGMNSGTGRAGEFFITNPSSGAYALVGESNGTVLGAGVYGINTGAGFGVYAKATNGTALGSAAVYGEQLGTGDAAGAFRINNTGSNKYALYGETNGTVGGNAAVSGLNLGSGNGAYFRKNGATAGSAAMWADNFGTDGYGAIIQNISASNPKPALFAEAVGAGSSIWANKDTGETGYALEATNIGTGYAVYANSKSTDAIYAEKKAGDAAGSAGNFQNLEPTNAASTLFSMTNAPGSPAIGAINSANGNALALFTGGIQLSTVEVTTGTTIANRAAAYRVSGGGPSYTLGFATSTGDVFMVYNDTAGSITFEGVTIPLGEGRIVINFNSGSFRGL